MFHIVQVLNFRVFFTIMKNSHFSESSRLYTARVPFPNVLSIFLVVEDNFVKYLCEKRNMLHIMQEFHFKMFLQSRVVSFFYRICCKQGSIFQLVCQFFSVLVEIFISKPFCDMASWSVLVLHVVGKLN